jgi:hypothetical protein
MLPAIEPNACYAFVVLLGCLLVCLWCGWVGILFCKLWFELGFVWLANVYDYEALALVLWIDLITLSHVVNAGKNCCNSLLFLSSDLSNSFFEFIANFKSSDSLKQSSNTIS